MPRRRSARLAVLACVPVMLAACSTGSGTATGTAVTSADPAAPTAPAATANADALDAACVPNAVSAAPDDGLRDRPVGVLALVPAAMLPAGWSPLDGADIAVNDNSVLFSQLGTAFGGDARPTFRLPRASGPWAQLPAADGTCLMWVLESVGYLPTEPPVDGFPGQVYFTAVQADRFAQILTQAGARPNDLGEAIAPGIRAFDLPRDWPAPEVMPLPGESRLFSVSVPLPAGFSATGLPAAPGYVWAVAG